MDINKEIEETVLETDQDGYEVNEELYDFLSTSYPDTVARLLNVFSVFYSLNSIYHNQDKMYIEKLEQRLLDIIATSENTEAAKEELEVYIKRAIFNYLLRYGVEIHIEKMSVYEAIDFLEGYSNLYNLDLPSTQDLLDQIADDGIDGIERLTSAVHSYSILSESTVYDFIQKAGDTFFNHIREYLRAKLYRGVEDVNVVDIEKLTPLLKADAKFSSTRIVTDILYYGYQESSLDDMLDQLYNYINWYRDDTTGIAYEVVAINYLSTDKPLNQNNIAQILNFKALDHLPYPESEDILVPKILEVMGLIQG